MNEVNLLNSTKEKFSFRELIDKQSILSIADKLKKELE